MGAAPAAVKLCLEISFLLKRNAAKAVTIPIVRNTGLASFSKREAEIPAAEAETAGAP